MYNVFDVIRKDTNMYLYLGKYKIYENNRLIDNYRYNSADCHIYVCISKVPKLDKNNIVFDDNYMFKFNKAKIRNVDIVSRLPMNLYDNINLFFKDKSFIARKKINGINPNDIKLLSSINENNYVSVIKMISNVEDLYLEFVYDKRRKIYVNTIYYFDKKFNLKFINDDFIFRILNPLITELINNNHYRITSNKNSFAINADNSYNILANDFQEEIILYLQSKFKNNDNGLVL